MPVSDDRIFRLEVLVRQLQRGRVAGQVAGNGTVVFGEGFSVSRTAAGKYTIGLATPMRSANYVVKVTPVTASSGTRVYGLARTGRSASAFSVELLDSAGTAVDSLFDFVAEMA